MALAALPLWAPALCGEPSSRTLAFEHTHTGEALEVTYYADGDYLADGLAQVNRLLRDHYSGDVTVMDPSLLDLLYELRQRTGTQAPFQIISGYRSPETNERLRTAGRGVAKRSMHIEGKAIDIRLADVPSDELRDAALAMQRGGVGYYEASNFVHVDVGRVRRW